MMKYIVLLFFTALNAFSVSSQNLNLENYSFVIVPEKFEFQSEPDKYQLNEMTLFYLNKYGFHAYMANNVPDANPCDGLYADVEEEKSLLWTKLQVVLRDCNGQEIYRSEVERSKFKEYEKSYPDALRRTFKHVEALRIKQRDILSSNKVEGKALPDTQQVEDEESSFSIPNEKTGIDKNFPTSKFSNFSQNGKSYLLRKTTEGYSLYEENAQVQDGLELLGKIILLNDVVKYMDISGNVSDVIFEDSGNFSIQNKTTPMKFLLVD